jgi:phosphoribosyl 1,2-cyclic phosphodiesterase
MPFFAFMPLYISSLNSGSNGNCYYVGNQQDAILVDAGLSCRETENRLNRQGLSIDSIRAIFISHEHTDHTYGVEIIARRYELPIYVSEKTLAKSKLRIDENLIRKIEPETPIRIGNLTIESFLKMHDAADPQSFTISDGEVTVGVFTDIGSVNENLIRHFSRCHAAFLESNYDEFMLEAGSYPRFLKNRISSDVGHLSNRQALQLFLDHKPEFMTHLLLAHLSQDNNDPALATALFKAHSNGMHVSVASREVESGVYYIV